MRRVLAMMLLSVAGSVAGAEEPERTWRGFVATEARSFDGNFQGSWVVEPEFDYRSGDGGRRFAAKLFARVDSLDDERTHADVRELFWERSARSWELRAGISKVFWGVTESRHLVDVVNQTDLVENPDGEDKLGQPMLKFSSIRNWGIVDVLVLPGFRERTFAGPDGRLGAPLAVDTDGARYESSAEQAHVDAALRWSRSAGPFDVGVAAFTGTNREPRLLPSGASLVPYYDQMTQLSLDLQATVGSWLWKLESIRRRDSLESFVATVGGFEYTFWGVGGSALDVGVLAEYHRDERRFSPTAFDDDWFVGARLGLNDTADTSVLAGMIYDPTTRARSALVEARRRFGDRWIVELELRTFRGGDTADPLDTLAKEDHLLISVQRHF